MNCTSHQVKEFCERNYIDMSQINSTGILDVIGNVSITTLQRKLPVKFGKIGGYFNCSAIGLTSLEGMPSYVNGDFSCSTNKLTSLEGAPSYVGGSFSCSINKITSFHDIHKFIKEINGDFYCNYNDIKDSMLGLLLIKGITRIICYEPREAVIILNKYLGQGRAGVIGAQQELLDANLDEYARL